MTVLSDNLTRLQGEVSAFSKQLADSHQDWEQIKLETHKLLSLHEQFQRELHRLKNLKATHRHIFICRAPGRCCIRSA